MCNPSTDSASEASNIDITKHEIPASATRNASFRSLFKSTTPANVFATFTNSCACHVFCNVPKCLRLPRKKHFEPPKTSRDRQFLTILTSKSFSRAPSSTSKSAPNPRCLNDFNFQIALTRRRGANFVDILGSQSFATPVFRTCLCEPSKPRNYGKTQHFAQFLPAKIFHVSHLCCKTSLLSNIDAARQSGNFQYSRKLELLNFLWI